jgi:multidrug efflux pump subunit AcrA (membrane-fusion protein)
MKKIKNFIQHHTVVVTLIAFVVIVIMVVAGRNASKMPATSTDSSVKQVTLVPATNFRSDLSTVSVDGVIESVSQVDIKSQVSAPIARVYVTVGDSVGVGQTIAELQNADIRAQLDQARAALVVAQGQYSSGNTSVQVSRRNAINTIRDNYIKMDDIMDGEAGQFLSTGNQGSVHLQSFVPDAGMINKLNVGWENLLNVLVKWKVSVDSLNDSSSQAQVDAALSIAEKSVSEMETYFNLASAALSDALGNANQETSAILNNMKAVMVAARASISASAAVLTSIGGSLSTNQAQISGAQAGVKNLEVQLAKTVITSPISGKIAALPLRAGEFAMAGQLFTTVVGSGGLQVKAYASSDDIDRLAKGAKVTLASGATGTVTAVSPSVNQLNKKVEVIIALSGDTTNLVVGQNVQAKVVAKTSTAAPTKSSYYILPIQNVKIIPGEAFVFTLDADSKIVKNPVTLGEVKGDYVEIKSGITDDMKLISPVYELNEGDVVKL